MNDGGDCRTALATPGLLKRGNFNIHLHNRVFPGLLYGAILYEVLSVKSISMGAHAMIKNRCVVTE